MKKKAYISIPITGKVYEKQKAAADELKEALQNDGFDVITPFDLCPEQGKSDAYYMGKCIEALIDCNVIFMCEGWQHSKGCKTERFTANEYGLEIRVV